MDQRVERKAKTVPAKNVAEAYLALLADRGVDYLFGNAGTDFAPIIEAYSHAAQTGVAVPQPILAAHENLAVAMAHGYGMVSRRIPAVMAHVSVGTANMICAALNASRENVAMLLSAGRSPLTETGLLGSRDGYIHWAQEMYDQAGMIREIVKWEYELQERRAVADGGGPRAVDCGKRAARSGVSLIAPRGHRGAGFRLGASLAIPAQSGIPGGAGCKRDCGGRTPARAGKAAAHRDRERRQGCGGIRCARAVRRALRNTGRPAPAALSFAAVVTSHESWIQPDAAASGCGCNSGDRERRSLDSRAKARPALTARSSNAGSTRLFARYPIRGFPGDVAITGGAAATLSALTAALDGQIRCRSGRAARTLDQGRARTADRRLERRTQGGHRQGPARSRLGQPLHRPGKGSAWHRDQ